MSKRKLYILQHDHSIIKSKKTVSELIRDGTIDSTTDWVLIPIQNTSATYIAVSGDSILSRQFAYAEIRYHMVFKIVGRPADTTPYEAALLKHKSLLPYHGETNPYETSIYDYYTTSVYANTIEELYNGLYNILYTLYLRDLIDTTEETDAFWFLDIQDFSVKLFNSSNKIVYQSEVIGSEIPFDTSVIDEMAKEIVTKFGLYHGATPMSIPNLYFKRDSEDRLTWGTYQRKIDLYSNIHSLLLFNPCTKACVILKRKEFDKLLKMHQACMYVAPIDLSDFSKRERIERLPVACNFGLQKYNLADWLNPAYGGESPEYIVFESYGPCVIELFSFNLFDPEDIAYALDNFYYFLQIYRECTKAFLLSNQHTEKIKENDRDCATLLLTFVGEINDIKGSPAESNLIIYTDPYEDNIPNVKEACAILAVQEKLC